MPLLKRGSGKSLIYNKSGNLGNKFIYRTDVQEGTPESEQKMMEEQRRQRDLEAGYIKYKCSKYHKHIEDEIARYRAAVFLNF